ncbi:unnamed protein product [Paramecium octaurelia]|uniref:HhH-GPD domain-containing protein n=1 Tax=Paramecium octaurelia TaxID=43137 RepID=A0A8S1VJB4_PAROT|nr:unnamed protein product [Paramecium octaurelia]
MRQTQKVMLAFSEATTSELNEILEHRFFKEKKSPKSKSKTSLSKQQSTAPMSAIKQENSGTKNIYEIIKQMRLERNAPVDLVGPQKCFDKDKDIETQRFQILTSLMLSPQTKDDVTSKCANRLLEYTMNDIANMDEPELIKLIYEVNFNVTKAKRIKDLAQLAIYKGMPKTFEETIKIKGVGEKIALLYMQVAFQRVEGIPIDVNMIRICNRIPILKEKSPTKLRKFLESQFEHKEWGEINETLVGFGQQICLPKPKCDQCKLKDICEYYKLQNTSD